MTALPLNRRDVARSVAREVAASKQEIAKRLRALQGPMTHRKVAEKIGVDVRNWGRWTSFSDPTIPSYESLEKIAAAFKGVSPEDLVSDDGALDTRAAQLDRIEALLTKLARALGVDPNESLEDEATRIADEADAAQRAERLANEEGAAATGR